MTDEMLGEADREGLAIYSLVIRQMRCNERLGSTEDKQVWGVGLEEGVGEKTLRSYMLMSSSAQQQHVGT